jgi:hypothetical protein
VEKIDIADLQYLYERPGQQFCRPCLNQLANGDMELQMRGANYLGRSFQETEEICHHCGKPRTVVRAPATK